MAPFFLLVVLVLLVVWRFFGPSIFGSGNESAAVDCAAGAREYVVRNGDTCWDIAERVSSTVDGLRDLNAGLDCDGLKPGMRMCVPAVGGVGR